MIQSKAFTRLVSIMNQSIVIRPLAKVEDQLMKIAFEKVPQRKERKNLTIQTQYFFTSSSNPNQVPLLEEVESKIMYILTKFKPSLFEPSRNGSPSLLMDKTEENKDQHHAKYNKDIPFSKLGIDSLDSTELIVAMEDSFGVDLSDEEAQSIESVGMAIDIFFLKVNAKVTNKIVERETEEMISVNRKKK